MDLLKDEWLRCRQRNGKEQPISIGQIALDDCVELVAPRPDFRGALYQFLIGLLQTAYAPQDLDEWRERCQASNVRSA